MKSLARAFCWIGLAAAAALTYAGVWFHQNYDAIMRIRFALGSFVLGALIGAYCLSSLVKSRQNGAGRF